MAGKQDLVADLAVVRCGVRHAGRDALRQADHYHRDHRSRRAFPTRAGDHARTLKRVPFVELSGYDLKIGEGTASAFAINSGRMAVKTILGNK